jgi:metallo-beta-lactamase family protein
VRAEIDSLDALSGHADSAELIEWVRPMATAPAHTAGGAGLKRIFLVHGENEERNALAAELQEAYRVTVSLPQPGDCFDFAAQ